MRTKEYFLKMIAAILCEQSIPLCPEDVDSSQLCKLASKNAVQGFLYLAIKNGSVTVPASIEASFKQVYMTNLMRDVTQSDERENIRKRFSDESIDFMFLKGSHLKELYPAPEIRYMVDMDVLVHEKDLKKGQEILLSQGFEQIMNNGKDIVFAHRPFLTIELHQMLFVEEYFMHDYFTDTWKRAEKVSKHEYKMSTNDLYVYVLAHLAEHYLEAGSCFRPMMDLFLMEKKLSDKLDFTYINQQFERIGIAGFGKKIRRLCDCMFAGGIYDDDLKTMENYIVLGAPVKDAEAAAKIASSKKSKIARYIEIAFPDYTSMVARYPTLKKVPFLLPFFWIHRIVKLIFTKDKTASKKRQQLAETDQNSVEIMREIFNLNDLWQDNFHEELVDENKIVFASNKFNLSEHDLNLLG